jgi:predicted thioesterase
LTTGLEVRLRAPAPVGAFLEVEARMEEQQGRRIELVASAACDGTEVATARGTFTVRG